MTLDMAVVYRCFDADDRLLYIGVTGEPRARLKGHHAKSPWFGDIARVTVTPRMPRREALDAERDAIIAERPLHNRDMRPRIPLPPIVEVAS